MSEFKRILGIASRSENLTHTDCGGEAEIRNHTITEVQEAIKSGMDEETLKVVESSLPMKVRLITCRKCNHREVEPL